MAVRLYVGNLSFETTEDDLRDYFGSVGAVSGCSVILDKFTNKSRGFGFVEMSSSDEANRAISEFNGKEFQGRMLKVNEAKPREERPPRGNGGYGGGGGGYGGGHDRSRR